MNTERNLTVAQILRSNSESVALLRKENYPELFKFAQVMVKNYLAYCFPNQVGIAAQFTADLIERCDTFRAADFINMFKFFRQRQDLESLRVYGNSITPQKLMEMVSVYENEIAEQREIMMSEKRGSLSEGNKTLDKIAPKLLEKFTAKSDKDIINNDLGMGKDYERVAAERERSGRDVSYPKQNHQDFFEK